MKDVFIGVDLFGQSAYWQDLHSNSSLLIAGLSGSGKSFLTSLIIDQFLEAHVPITVISDKAKVDFKNPVLRRIDPLEDTAELERFIEETESFMRSRKKMIEESSHSHGRFLMRPEKRLIVVDELWSIAKLPKEMRTRFESLLELVIRQGRYLEIYCAFVSQISSVSETAIPIRQCSLILTGKTDTRQLSESLFGTSIAYDSDFLRQGLFVMWDRLSPPRFVRVAEKRRRKFTIYVAWILKSLKRIWTMLR